MLKVRIIPCLDVDNGRVVKGVNFVDLVDAGDPVEQARVYDREGADELCFLDITASVEARDTILDIAAGTAEQCFMPLTVGGGVRATAERLLEQARAADAHLLAADRFRIAEERFQAGEEAMNRYDLDDAARNFQAAADAAAAAVETAGMQAPDATGELVDQLMQAVMKEIEAASHLTVITDDGMGVEPKPWDGATVLGAGGKVPDAGMAEVSVAGLGGLDQAPQHLLLERAKELWRAGVARQAAEEYAAAVAYFEEARAYVMAFESLAVLAVYTVRLIPERRDSLWRIAEYDFIYGNPWLWPKIFHRNRKLIQDPDLIYPGWQLIIPPR